MDIGISLKIVYVIGISQIDPKTFLGFHLWHHRIATVDPTLRQKDLVRDNLLDRRQKIRYSSTASTEEGGCLEFGVMSKVDDTAFSFDLLMMSVVQTRQITAIIEYLLRSINKRK